MPNTTVRTPWQYLEMAEALLDSARNQIQGPLGIPAGDRMTLATIQGLAVLGAAHAFMAIVTDGIDEDE